MSLGLRYARAESYETATSADHHRSTARPVVSVPRAIRVEISVLEGERDRPRDPRALELPSTLHWDRFEWITAPLGNLPAGEHRLRLRVVGDGQGGINLDQLAMYSGERAVLEKVSPAVFRAEGIEVRASHGAGVFDPPWLLHVLREQRDYIAGILCFELTRPLVLALVSGEDWPDPATGAFQSGPIVYLREDRAQFLWRDYGHEIVHVFQEEIPVGLPWFFTEGLAMTLQTEIEIDLFDRVKIVESSLRDLELLLEIGDELFRPGSGGVHPLFAEAGEGFPSRPCYDWAHAIVWSLHQRFGAGLWPAVHARLRSPDGPMGSILRGTSLADAKGPLARSRALVELLQSSAAADLWPFFEQLGLPRANED